MKFAKRVFALLAVLALAVLAAGNLLLWPQRNDLKLDGEVLYGERADAAGVRLSYDRELESHLNWSIDYDLGTGEQTMQSDWTLKGDGREGTSPVEPQISLTINMGGSGYRWLDGEPDFHSEYIYDVYADMVEMAGDAETYTRRLRLNDYTDIMPVAMDAYGANLYEDLPESGFDYDVSEYFPIPLPEEVWMEVTLERSAASSRLSIEFLDSQYMGGIYDSSLCAADGNLYINFCVRDEEGALLDGSRMPGGSWGVYRIPCEGDTIRLSGMELVYAIGEEVQGEALLLSEDRERLLIFTAEDDALYLNVMDAGSGELLQRQLLLVGSDWSFSERYTLADATSGAVVTPVDGYYLLGVGNVLQVLSEGGGLYTPVLTVDTSNPPAPERYENEDCYVYNSGTMFYATDGERLVVLDNSSVGDYSDPENSTMTEYLQVNVYDGSGLIYSEWLTGQFERVNAYNRTLALPRLTLDVSIEQ